MKKTTIYLLTTILTISLFSATANAAEITYPYSPSEIVKLFDEAYTDQYDQINTDLNDNLVISRDWSENAMVGQFQVNYADGIEYGYSFEYISETIPEESFLALPTIEGEWYTEVSNNPENLTQGIAMVSLKLRQLVPAMIADERLLFALDRLTEEDANTSLFITLKYDENGDLMWFMDFQISNAAGTHHDFLVKVSASDNGKPYFMAVQKSKK